MLAARLAAVLAAALPGLALFFALGKSLLLAVILLDALLIIFVLPSLFRSGFYLKKRLSISSASRPAFFWGSFYVLLYVVGIFRGAFFGTTSVVTGAVSLFNFLLPVAASVILYSATSRKNQGPLGYFQLVMDALAYYCLLNLVGWILGLESPAAATSPVVSDRNFLLSLVGININRVFFPFAQGVNTFGVIAGVTAAHGAFYVLDRWRYGKRPAGHAVLLHLLVPGVCLLLCDSRGAVLFVLLALLFASVHGRVIVLLTISIIAVFIFQIFAGDILSGLSLGGGDRDSSATGILSGREFIWAAVVAELLDPKLIHLVGFGIYGQVASGVSVFYSSYFEGWVSDENMISVHNGLLQAILDVGYFGVASFSLFFYFSLTALEKYSIFSPSEKYAVKAISCAVIYLLLQGLTEVSLNASNPQVFYVIIALAVCFFRLSRRSLDVVR